MLKIKEQTVYIMYPDNLYVVFVLGFLTCLSWFRTVTIVLPWGSSISHCSLSSLWGSFAGREAWIIVRMKGRDGLALILLWQVTSWKKWDKWIISMLRWFVEVLHAITQQNKLDVCYIMAGPDMCPAEFCFQWWPLAADLKKGSKKWG